MGEESEGAGAAADVTPAPAPEANGDEAEEAVGGGVELGEERFAELAAREEFLLSLSEKGFGVRTSAYDYRITNRGGQGIENMDLSRRGDALVAVFPVGQAAEVIVVADSGQGFRGPGSVIRMRRAVNKHAVGFRS